MIAEAERIEDQRAPVHEAEYDMINRLNHSFETFIGITGELKEAYDRLRERAAAMDLELQEANCQLSQKVAELDDLTRRLNDLLQSLPSAVVAVDENGRVILFNRAAEQLTGLRLEGILGKRLEEVDHTGDFLLLPGGGGTKERTVLTKDGRRLVVASRVSELRDGQGRPAGWIEILTDLTETDRLRREVHRLDTLAAMGEMAAAVAHQIRNPLNGVEGFASLLVRNLSKGEASMDDGLRYGRNIIRGVQEVNAIISGMLMLARPDHLDLKPVHLDSLMEAVAEGTNLTAESMGDEARVCFRPGAPDAWVTADELKLKQVFINLARNALEALGNAEGRMIRLRTRAKGELVEVRVTDTGRGMEGEAVEKLFRPFYTTREGGCGLGLSVAAKFVELHGGRINVRSIPGLATVFKVTLSSRRSSEKPGEKDD